MKTASTLILAALCLASCSTAPDGTKTFAGFSNWGQAVQTGTQIAGAIKDARSKNIEVTATK